MATIEVDPFVVTEALNAKLYLEHTSLGESHETSCFGAEDMNTPDLKYQPTQLCNPNADAKERFYSSVTIPTKQSLMNTCSL